MLVKERYNKFLHLHNCLLISGFGEALEFFLMANISSFKGVLLALCQLPVAFKIEENCFLIHLKTSFCS